jgi:hypothetical protein
MQLGGEGAVMTKKTAREKSFHERLITPTGEFFIEHAPVCRAKLSNSSAVQRNPVIMR